MHILCRSILIKKNKFEFWETNLVEFDYTLHQPIKHVIENADQSVINTRTAKNNFGRFGFFYYGFILYLSKV